MSLPSAARRSRAACIDRWINLKVLINADNTASQYWVNNCLVASQGSGTRGDGNNYFKVGVYHCDAGTCRAAREEPPPVHEAVAH